MNTTRMRVVLGLLVLVGVVGVIAKRGSDPYRVSVPLKSGYGLEDGSAVRIGGVIRGKVRLRIAKNDTIMADLELDTDAGRVGKDARVAVEAANFLGQKRVELDPGDVQGNPAPSGFVLAGTNATTPTDLDQVLGVFDADTRVRARILINAAGEAVVGRKADISKLIGELPTGLDDAAAVVGQIATDNATMRALVRRSNKFVTEAVTQRKDLGRMIDVLASTSTTVAQKRVALRQTLARAPGTLRSLRAFSRDLHATAGELSPAAREIANAAPALDDTLAKVDAFRVAADPALRSATALAPDLTTLARKGTPVVKLATPTARSIAELSDALRPVSTTLDRSFDNLIAVVDNWGSHAIQFRDGLGHIFRGEATVGPNAVLSAVGKLTRPPDKRKTTKGAATSPDPEKPSRPGPSSKRPGIKTPEKPELPLPRVPSLGDVIDAVGATIGRLTGTSPQEPETERPSGDETNALLDYLLGR